MVQGRWNRLLGWILLVLGLVGAAWLDLSATSPGDSSFLAANLQDVWRKGQVGVLEMAFLQLVLPMIMSGAVFPPFLRRAVFLLSGLGVLVYVGALVLTAWPGAGWFLALGAMMNSLVFCFLLTRCSPIGTIKGLRIILGVFCAGMALDALLGGLAASPVPFFSYLGSEEGVRWRMLRLAQVAVVALPVIAFFYQELAERTAKVDSYVRIGQIGLLVGAVGMPVVLVMAAFTSVHIKYLLPIPALATFLGTAMGLWLAKTAARFLEMWGWGFIALSMSAGLFMGLYAFDGPLPTPGFLGDYNEFPRRLSRMVHAYAIVFGMASIFLARERERPKILDLTFRSNPGLSYFGNENCP